MKTIDLYEAFGIDRGDAIAGYLECYRHTPMSEMKPRIHPAILIIPGGAYCMVAEHEGAGIAHQFLAMGYDCYVLQYDVAPHCYPTQLLQAGMAMAYLRDHAKELYLDEKHIAVMGFSAGGHLSGSISLLWDDQALCAIPGENARLRPDAAVLCYPVVTSDERYWHEQSIRNFCGDKVPFENYSLEKRVRKDAPPVFLWTTSQDNGVPVQNSILLYSALQEAGVGAELHVFEQGWHGLATADDECIDPSVAPFAYHVAHWKQLACEFLRGHGFVINA